MLTCHKDPGFHRVYRHQRSSPHPSTGPPPPPLFPLPIVPSPQPPQPPHFHSTHQQRFRCSRNCCCSCCCCSWCCCSCCCCSCCCCYCCSSNGWTATVTKPSVLGPPHDQEGGLQRSPGDCSGPLDPKASCSVLGPLAASGPRARSYSSRPPPGEWCPGATIVGQRGADSCLDTVCRPSARTTTADPP